MPYTKLFYKLQYNITVLTVSSYYLYILCLVFFFIKFFLCLDVSMPGEEGSDDKVSMSSLQECTSTTQVHNQSVSARKRGKLWDLHPLLGQCLPIFLRSFILLLIKVVYLLP